MSSCCPVCHCRGEACHCGEEGFRPLSVEPRHIMDGLSLTLSLFTQDGGEERGCHHKGHGWWVSVADNDTIGAEPLDVWQKRTGRVIVFWRDVQRR